jgi:NAD(P)-binding Rossmann-like domain
MIKTDYLIVGAGAMGMAFADTLVSESDARLVIVDRGPQPGGHWTRAYPFVRLHQPSAYYGVNSRKLETGAIDRVGWNEGLHELATGGEVCAYFDRVMQQELLPTGRVSYFPMSEYLGDGRIRTLAGTEVSVDVRRRVVDATYLQTLVPSMRPPPYHVADGVACVAPNALPLAAPGHQQFVIVGAGKTGIDTCLWLLRNGIDADRLTWIMSRDAWLLDRVNVQPGAEFLDQLKAHSAARLDAITAATSVDDLFDRLEASGVLLRIDPNVRPTMYRCAIVSRPELEQLRRIKRIVRMGRVQRIEPGGMVLADGNLHLDGPALYIDCSADGLERRSGVTVFDGDRITLQSVRGCQQVFSAGLIGHVEVSYDDDATKNSLCVPVPHPNTDLHWLQMTLAEQRNEISWIEQSELMDWLATSRLNLTRGLYAPLLERQRARERLLGMVKSALHKANDKLEELIAQSR